MVCSCSKCMIIFWNVWIAAFGLAIGITATIQVAKYESKYELGGCFLGFAIFGISFVAFLGAAFENRCLLLTYIALISVMMVAKLALGIFMVAFFNSDEYQYDIAIQHIGMSDKTDHETSEFAAKGFLDYVKTNGPSGGTYECCGCRPGSSNKTENYESVHKVQLSCKGLDARTDCCAAFSKMLAGGAIIVGAIMLAGIVIDILAITFAALLSNDIKKRTSHVHVRMRHIH